MVYRIYVRKKEGFNAKEKGLLSDLKTFLGISNLENVKIFNRYDLDEISEEDFKKAVDLILSEKQVDETYTSLNDDASIVFGVEYLPGQFDVRANSASQCIQLLTQKQRPLVKTATIYKLYGNLSNDDVKKIQDYLINPVEARLASLSSYDSLIETYPKPNKVKIIDGFISYTKNQLEQFLTSNGLAMDLADLEFCQEYFKSEKRDPSITEIKVIDTYWSDHCRHTTFLTQLDNVIFEDSTIQKAYEEYLEYRKQVNDKKPICLMDIATIGIKVLKKLGKLDKLDESEEVNACTVKIKVDVDNKLEDWLLLFKNETHNHPTEIEPFGGAATCIGGAIRDPLSGRSYVYGAMRITGAGDPTSEISKTLKGKLPQKKICQTASDGYSSYGNQIGLATGYVNEIYHPNYVAKRMEIGAVIAATPSENVIRLTPQEGDVVILLGGRTGRDGCGGATGSSKAHDVTSLSHCGAEVQKGNPLEERKLQRLFRNPKATKLIKRCNDFGAGGVSVAIGELADGLDIDLNAVTKKYEGLDGTELAISESQERMAVVVNYNDAKEFLELANRENLEANIVAKVTSKPYLSMRWNDEVIVNISREFLSSNGAKKHVDVKVNKQGNYSKNITGDFKSNYFDLVSDLNVCSQQGLVNRFDSTIGANTILMPYGGKYQLTPEQVLAFKVSVEKGHTNLASIMSYGFNPFISEINQYKGAYLAVIESVSKLIAAGCKYKDIYLTFQEYFERLNKDASRWGKPLSSLLGALKAQLDLQIASIGGKDSMSGSFENIDVPPSLVSFAVTTSDVNNIVSNEFKQVGHKVILLKPKYEDELPEISSLLDVFKACEELVSSKKVYSMYAVSYGGVSEAIFKQAIGNKLGFEYNSNLSLNLIFNYSYGSIIVEVEDIDDVSKLNFEVIELGKIISEAKFTYQNQEILLEDLLKRYEDKLENVYPVNFKKQNEVWKKQKVEKVSYKIDKYPHSPTTIYKPKILIPVFPGTNCEYDTAKKAIDEGLNPTIYVINNLTSQDIVKSTYEFAKLIRESQIIFIPGGFSGGDEPDGSAKFITSFFRNKLIKDEVENLLDKNGGLIAGICNGFQALVKLGLLPYGKILDCDEHSPTLTFNTISRHQSMIVRTRIASNKSIWLKNTKVDEIYNVAISHGEGRFVIEDNLLSELVKNGQIATQYVDLNNNPTMDIHFNPNGSTLAIEGICSKDGRIFGKMGHAERSGYGLYKNVPGNYELKMFKSAKEYFDKN